MSGPINEGSPFERVFDPTMPIQAEDTMERPPKSKVNARDLVKQVLELEMALGARDTYADKQQKKIEDLISKVEQYERFFHALQMNYQVLHDHRAVQELIDRACQWSLAYRNYHGELQMMDRSAALEMATRRLQGDP